MKRVLRIELAVLTTCLGLICVMAPLAAQAGPVDFVRNLFHRKKPQVQQIQQIYYRQRAQAGIQITQPVPTKKFAFQENPAF